MVLCEMFHSLQSSGLCVRVPPSFSEAQCASKCPKVKEDTILRNFTGVVCFEERDKHKGKTIAGTGRQVR